RRGMPSAVSPSAVSSRKSPRPSISSAMARRKPATAPRPRRRYSLYAVSAAAMALSTSAAPHPEYVATVSPVRGFREEKAARNGAMQAPATTDGDLGEGMRVLSGGDRVIRSEQPARRQVFREGRCSEGPRRGLVAVRHPVLKRAQLVRPDANHVADLVGEAFSAPIPILRGREQSPREQGDAVGVLVISAHGLPDQLQDVATDEAHAAHFLEPESVRPLHHDLDVLAADIVDGKGGVEQANERADGARGVVVLGLAQEQ